MYLFVRLQGSWFLVSQFSYFCDKFIYYKLWIESTGTAHVCKKQASHPKSRVSSCVEKTQLPISITQILVRSAFQPIIQLRTSEKESGSLVFLVLLLLLGLCLLEVALCTPRTCREKHNPKLMHCVAQREGLDHSSAIGGFVWIWPHPRKAMLCRSPSVKIKMPNLGLVLHNASAPGSHAVV